MSDAPNRWPFQFGIRALFAITTGVAFFFAFMRISWGFFVAFVLYGSALVILIAAIILHRLSRSPDMMQLAVRRRARSFVNYMMFVAIVLALAALLANWGKILGILINDR